jgi:sec-independent protein translocase protein TatA
VEEEEIQMLAEIFGLDGVVVLVVVLALLFGGAAIPKLARSLGSAKNEFEKGLDEGKKASTAPTPITSGATVTDLSPSEAPVMGHIAPGG